MLWLLLACAFLAVVCASSDVEEPKEIYKKLEKVHRQLRNGTSATLPFENDRTGFYDDYFLHQLSQDDPTALSLLDDENFQKNYRFRVISAALNSGQYELVQKHFSRCQDYQEWIQRLTFKDKFKAACSYSDLVDLVQLFKEHKPDASVFDVFEFKFDGSSTVLHEAIRSNNLVLLRDCLGLDEYSNPDPSLPSADPNEFAEHPHILQFKVTPLMLAVSLGFHDAAALLMKHPQIEPDKALVFGLHARSFAYNFSFELKWKMLGLFKQKPLKKSLEACNGDGFAQSIFNGRSDACLEAHLWNLEYEASDTVVAAAIFMKRTDVLFQLIKEEKLVFDGMEKSTKAFIFESLMSLEKKEHLKMMTKFLGDYGFPFDMDDRNEYYYGDVQIGYYVSPMERIFTQMIPYAVTKILIKKKFISEKDLLLMITWALGRHDVPLLKCILKNYPEQMINYADPLTGEPIIHIVVKKLYPAVCCHRFIKKLIKAGVDVYAEYEGKESFWIDMPKHYEKEKKSYWATTFNTASGKSKDQFEYTFRGKYEAKSPNTIEAFLALSIYADEDLQNLFKEHFDLKKVKAEAEKDAKFPLFDNEDVRERAFFARRNYQLQGELFWPCDPEHWFNMNLIQGCKPSDEAIEKIDESYPIGPQGYSVFHALLSPGIKAASLQLDVLASTFIKRGFDVNYPAITGEKIVGFDEDGEACERDCQGWTPLQMAVFQREWNLAALLLRAKAEVFHTGPDGYQCAFALLDHLHQSTSKEEIKA